MKHQNEFHVLCHWDWLVFQHGLGRCVWFLVGKKGVGDNCLPVLLTHQQRIPRVRNISCLADSRDWCGLSRREGKRESDKIHKQGQSRSWFFKSRQGGVCIW